MGIRHIMIYINYIISCISWPSKERGRMIDIIGDMS